MANVVVVCRFRPPSRGERASGSAIVGGALDSKTAQLRLGGSGPGAGSPTFIFDQVFDVGSTQEEVFDHSAKHFVKDIFSGFNSTIFAYGQTGSGKTHSMMGEVKTPQRGIIPRLVEAIFAGIEEAPPEIEFTVKVSYVEIYNEKLRDLLDPAKDDLKIREGSKGVWIEGVTENYVGANDQVLEIMNQGATNRAIASTNMNSESSRSHSVFILTLGQRDTKSEGKKESKLTLIDLAGSEKISKTGAEGKTLKEAQNINKSLSALGNVINALTSAGKKHVPYRDSKLTRLLSDSLGGNSKTLLLVTCSPCADNVEESVSTLRFGQRAKTIKNKPIANVEKSVAEYIKLLAAAQTRINAQTQIIRLLEKDVVDLRNCVAGVDAKYLRTPMPTIKRHTLEEIMAGVKGAADDEKKEKEEDDTDDTKSVSSDDGGDTSSTSSSESKESSSSSSSSSSASSRSPSPSPPIIVTPPAPATPTVVAPTPAPTPATAPTTPFASIAVAPLATPAPSTPARRTIHISPSPSLSSPIPMSPSPPPQAASPSPTLSPLPAPGGATLSAPPPLPRGMSIFVAPPSGGASMGINLLAGVPTTGAHDSVIAESAALQERMTELEKERKDAQDQLADKVRELEEHRADVIRAAEQLKEEKEKRDEAEKRAAQTETLLQDLSLLRSKMGTLEREHALQQSAARDERLELQRQLGEMKTRSAAPVAPGPAGITSSTSAPSGLSVAAMGGAPSPSTSSASKDAYADQLAAQLKKKCDQYAELAQVQESRRDQIVLLERALDDVKSKSAHRDTEVKRLTDELQSAKHMCKRLLESGLYWRQLRKTEMGQTGVVTLQGGGGAVVTMQGGGNKRPVVHGHGGAVISGGAAAAHAAAGSGGMTHHGPPPPSPMSIVRGTEHQRMFSSPGGSAGTGGTGGSAVGMPGVAGARLSASGTTPLRIHPNTSPLSAAGSPAPAKTAAPSTPGGPGGQPLVGTPGLGGALVVTSAVSAAAAGSGPPPIAPRPASFTTPPR